VISRYGVGVDKVDLQAAHEKGIVVTNTPGANSVSVAELTIGLMLALARHIPEACAATRMGEWPRVFGMTLEGKCAGLLGLGSIGKQVALRLEVFGCRLAAYDPYPDLEFAHQHGVELLGLSELLQQADFISLHLPLNETTRGRVNADFLGRMKRGAFLVNTARGELVDETAVAEAVSTGHLGGAALDVFSHEPPGKDNPLLGLPQVIVTPHTASHTDGAMQRMGWMALEDCLSVLRGDQPRYAVELTSGAENG
jgi:phosphoglycerate dehydrogenase-like enzyme